MRRAGALASAIAVAVAMCLVGCSPRDNLGFTPVTGSVLLDGKPLTGGEVRFVPDAARGNSGPQSVGVLGPSGTFTLYGPGGRVGAVPGQHRVFLAMAWQEGPLPPIVIDGKEVARQPVGNPPAQLPKRYLAVETSGLTATVTRGEPAHVDFNLVSTPLKKGATP